MRAPYQWPSRCRLLAASAAVDWSRATLSRAGQHLAEAELPQQTEPITAELKTISSRLAQLRNQIEQAAQ